MVYLQMKAMDFGISDVALKAAGCEYVRAPYNTLEEAQAQAQHNIDTHTQVPINIVDENDEILVDYRE